LNRTIVFTLRDSVDWLERLYEYLPWPMKPGEEKAEKRFSSAVKFFSSLLQHESLGGIRKEFVSVLDVMSGTGIGGAAAAKAFVDGGFKVRLVALDKRKSDLSYVDKWLEFAGILDETELETVVADVEELPLKVHGKFDLVLIWGSSMPHLIPWTAAKVLAGIREVSSSDGVLTVEQWDIAGTLLIRNQFRHILLEGGIDDEGSGILSFHLGYDPFRGVEERAYYRLPGMEFLLKSKVHLWSLSELATMIWMFYEKIDLREQEGGKMVRPVLVAWRPRKVAVPYSELSYPFDTGSST